MVRVQGLSLRDPSAKPATFESHLFITKSKPRGGGVLTLVRLCLMLQNLPASIKIQRAYQSLHGMQDPIELKYATKWDDPLPKRKPRLSPSRRKLKIEVLVADYEAGGSLRELAAKYGVNRKTVALQLRKAGVVLRLPACNVRGQMILT